MAILLPRLSDLGADTNTQQFTRVQIISKIAWQIVCDQQMDLVTVRLNCFVPNLTVVWSPCALGQMIAGFK